MIQEHALEFGLADRVADAWRLVTQWTSRMFLAVVDQGLISGSNFVIGILLARWMTPSVYGAYALAFSLFLLLSQFHSSLLLEPMAVFGSSIYKNRLRGYLGSLLWIHAAIGMLILLVLLTSAGVARVLGLNGDFPSALAGVALAAPFVLLLWLARRAFYLNLSPGWAAVGALFYCALVLGGFPVIKHYGLLTSFSAFLLMGAGGLLTSVLLLWRAQPVLSISRARPNLLETWSQHWDYGRWALATSVLLWIPSNVYLPLLGAFGGMASAGEMKALTNLALPVGQTATALSLLFQTYASRVYEEHGARALARFSAKVTALYAAGGALYWVAMVVFGRPLVSALYAGNYDALPQLVPMLALASIVQIAIAGPCIGLRAMQSPASVFVAYSASGAVSLLAGVPLTWAFGLRGVICSMVAASLTGLVTSYVLLHRRAATETAAKTATDTAVETAVETAAHSGGHN